MNRLFAFLGYVCLFAAATTASAATFTVVNTADSGAGSLRQAILDANGNGGHDTIEFNIPGAGVQTITPASALPMITSPVLINGYSQPGASVNTQSSGNDAVLLINLDGVTNAFHGLQLSGGAGNSTIRGLVIQRFASGIHLASTTGVSIAGNWIGTDPTGTLDRGNGTGVFADFGGSHIIGTVNEANRNVISGNNNNGIALSASVLNSVSGNYIGTNATGTAAIGNIAGITISDADDNVIGPSNVISGNSIGGLSAAVWISGGAEDNQIVGNLIGVQSNGVTALANRYGIVLSDNAGAAPAGTIIGGATNSANVIANNVQDGVSLRVVSPAVPLNNTITYNLIRDNGDLGIDHGNDGVTLNDAGDGDAGANLLQNYPVVTTAQRSSANTFFITGTLNSTPSSSFLVQLHYATACDANGFGEGSYLGETNVTTDAGGNAAFSVTIPSAIGTAGVVTATATDANGNTSEFSACVAIAPAPQPGINIGNASVTEGDAGTVPMSFSVTLSQASPFPVSAVYTTQDGTAAFPADYQAASGSVVFAPGDTEETITVLVNGDVLAEADETFSVLLAFPTDAVIVDGTGTGTIEDDDGTVDLAVTKSGPAAMQPGSQVTYTITVTNDGSAAATNVTVVDPLPASLTFVSTTPTQGSCSGPAPVTCNLGTLAAGGTATITLVATASNTPQPVSNTATATATEADADPGDNSGTADAAIVAAIPTAGELGLLLVAAMLAAVALLRLR
ncbi:MAG TPA: Calx-beta domain-containing protein [Thermoanaerobaculia bacterium]|nr:Calx-beta domain-containing protein [Thermoanaerobaculia bacterium]